MLKRKEHPPAVEGFPCTVTVPVRFRDLDAMGHVNNAVFLTLFEVARTEFLTRHFGLGGLQDIDFLVVRAEVDYLRPVTMTPAEIGVRLSRIGTRSFEVEYQLVAEGQVAARGRTVQAFFDAAAQKSKEVPEAFRAAAARLESGGTC